MSSFMLGVEHVSGGELARGAEELERFVNWRPHVRVVDAREALGRASSALNQLDQAAAQLTEVVRLQPGKGPAHAYLGE